MGILSYIIFCTFAIVLLIFGDAVFLYLCRKYFKPAYLSLVITGNQLFERRIRSGIIHGSPVPRRKTMRTNFKPLGVYGMDAKSEYG